MELPDLSPLGARGAQWSYELETATDEGRNTDRMKLLTAAGDALAANGELRRARTCFDQALTVAVETRSRRVEGDVAWRLAQIETALGRADQAIANYERAARCFERDGDREDHCVALLAGARLKLRARGAGDALRELREAVEIARTLSEPEHLAASMEALAEAYGWLGRWDSAEASYGEAARRFRAAGSLEGTLRSTVGLAEAQLELDRHVEAIKTLAPLEESLEVLESDETKGRGLGLLAVFYLKAGQESEAKDNFERALEAFNEANATSRAATLMERFARELRRTGEPQLAAQLYGNAVTIYSDLGELTKLGPVTYRLAESHFANGDSIRADEAIEQALSVCQRLSDVEGLEVSTALALRIAIALGQGELALRRILLAARVKGELGDQQGELRYLLNALELALNVGDDLDAVGVAEALVASLRSTGPSLLGPDELSRLAEQLEAAERPAYAGEVLVMVAQGDLGNGKPAAAAAAMSEAAGYYIRADDPAAALDLWEQAIAIGEVHGLADTEHWVLERNALAEA